METYKKILVAAPVYDRMRYCWKEFLEAVKKIEYPHEILIVDNSRADDFFEELKKESGIIAKKCKTDEEENMKRLVDSRNLILEYAKYEDYDYVLMMDSDVIPPVEIIPELLKHEKEIVSGMYYNYFNVSGESRLEPVAWKSISEEEFRLLREKMNLPDSMKAEDLRRHLTNEEADSNNLLEVLYPSAGCMLLSRAVFEKVRYGLIKTDVRTSDDIFFINEARKAGFKVYVDTKIKCRHLISGKLNKDKDGSLSHQLYG